MCATEVNRTALIKDIERDSTKSERKRHKNDALYLKLQGFIDYSRKLLLISPNPYDKLIQEWALATAI